MAGNPDGVRMQLGWIGPVVILAVGGWGVASGCVVSPQGLCRTA
ncbi:hypothetical protein OAM99_04570 [Planktomarina sp.]|nr:hypothetical protein [Planktomarina sp.]